MEGPSPLDRPDLYVVARLLERLWREESAILKTRLQVATNLNYDVFRKYLAWLVEHGLATLENSADGHEKVKLTPKGEEAYRKLVLWINEVVRGREPGF
jgi:predicted transcriptional regulator